jgi:predicted transcriptional regulator
MKHRRSETDIVAEILRATLKEPGITKVMYSTNLNHVTAEDYLDQLQKKGLIEIIAQLPRKRYRTTLRGKQVLDHLEEVSQLLQQ